MCLKCHNTSTKCCVRPFLEYSLLTCAINPFHSVSTVNLFCHWAVCMFKLCWFFKSSLLNWFYDASLYVILFFHFGLSTGGIYLEMWSFIYVALETRGLVCLVCYFPLFHSIGKFFIFWLGVLEWDWVGFSTFLLGVCPI